MRRVGVEPVTKTKFRIYLDGQFAFILYKSELSACRLRDGEEITEEAVGRILTEIVLKRAKRKAMALLQSMDRTESELRGRLLTQEYPEQIVEQAVRYVKSFGYVDDRRYVESFILSRKSRKSRKEIRAELARKRVDSEIVEEMMEQCYGGEDTQEAIGHLLRKRRFDPETATAAEKQKICAYLARKGFSYGDIRKALEVDFMEG